jgi:hypothetical protein
MGNRGAFEAGVMVWPSKIERVGELYDELSIGENSSVSLSPARLGENHEQIVSRAIDPIESEVDIEQIGQVVVLEGRTGEPIVGEVVIYPDIAHA